MLPITCTNKYIYIYGVPYAKLITKNYRSLSHLTNEEIRYLELYPVNDHGYIAKIIDVGKLRFIAGWAEPDFYLAGKLYIKRVATSYSMIKVKVSDHQDDI